MGGAEQSRRASGAPLALERCEATRERLRPVEAFTRHRNAIKGGLAWPRDAHNKAAEHHESAAKSHRTAAEHHGKGEHAKGREELAKAYGHSKTAHEHSEMAHGESQTQK